MSPLFMFPSNPTAAILLVIAFVVAIVAHEGNHALFATLLGDNTPRLAGRLSLNPLRHVDRLGLLMFVIAGFGWASTPVNPRNLRPNPRTGNAIVAAAGPVANLALALILAIIIREAPRGSSEDLLYFLRLAMALNLLLFCFNLIPLPPLDGFTVLLGLLPLPLAMQLRQVERWGPGVLLIVLLVVPSLFHFDLVGLIFSQVSRTFLRWVNI